jgi:hypothetical protein
LPESATFLSTNKRYAARWFLKPSKRRHYSMSRANVLRIGKWVACAVAVSVLISACGGKRKRFFEQVTILVETNDKIDAKVAKLPKINAFKDPDYLQKLDSYIVQKETIRGTMEALEPPFMLASTHNKLLIAMNNGIRYLYSEREKFIIAEEKMKRTVPKAPRGREEFEIIKEYQSQTAAYQARPKEQLMKKQYERLYWEAKDELERAKKF